MKTGKIEKVLLIMVWPFFPRNRRKPWKEFLSGLENHDCKFETPSNVGGYKFKRCTHFGCNACDPE